MEQCKCLKTFKNRDSLLGHIKNCKNHKEYVDQILTKEFLEEMISNRYPTLHIANVILKDHPFINNGTINNKAKKYGLKLLTPKESALSKTTRMKFENTCIQKFGAKNVLSSGTKIFKKRNNTVKKKYGVDNVFQVDSIKEKIKNTLIENYGTSDPTKFPGRIKNVGKKSYPHKIVEGWLLEKNILFESEKELRSLVMFNEDLGRIYKPRPDIFIESLNLIIEIYGDQWHANPKKYNDNDIIYTWSGEKKAKEIRKNNQIREKHINDCGFKIIILWVSDIKNNATSNIKRKLFKEIKKWEKTLKSSRSKKFLKRIDTIYL